MRATEFLQEGGWTTTATQETVINPAIVRATLEKINQLVASYNATQVKEKQVAVGSPLGSTAYYTVDPEDKVYGDIDIQMLAPDPIDVEANTPSQFSSYWNKELQGHITATNLPFVYAQESILGHPIFKLDTGDLVQVDFIWSRYENKDWARLRATPEHNLKGLLYGQLFSTLALLTMTSIGYAGVQQKLIDNQPVPFIKRKGTKLVTITASPHTFLLDMLNYLAKRQAVSPKVDPLLKSNPGIGRTEVKAETLVKGIVGLARSFEASGMYGKDILERFANAEDFLTVFKDVYEADSNQEIAARKRDKAATPAAVARAERDKEMVRVGTAKVLGMFP